MAILTDEEKEIAGSRIDGGYNKLRKIMMNKMGTANKKSDLRGEYIAAQSSDVIRLFNIMEWRCVYCGTETLFFEQDGLFHSNMNTIDHVESLRKGGLNVIENIVCSCLECNNKKNNNELSYHLAKMNIDEQVFRAKIEGYLQRFHDLTKALDTWTITFDGRRMAEIGQTVDIPYISPLGYIYTDNFKTCIKIAASIRDAYNKNNRDNPIRSTGKDGYIIYYIKSKVDGSDIALLELRKEEK